MLSIQDQFIINNYKGVKLLGEGKLGTTYLVEEKTTKQNFVAKATRSTKYAINMNEIQLLTEFQNEYLVRIWECFEVEGKLYIIMDFESGGTLQGLLINRRIEKQHLTESQIIRIIQHILLSLKILHDKKMAHKDLRPQNIFLGRNFHIRLGDFGLASILTTQNENDYYDPPEFRGNIEIKNLESDIWSLGKIMYELITLDAPLSGNLNGSFNESLLKEKTTPELFNICSKMMSLEPLDRPSLFEIQKHLAELTTKRDILTNNRCDSPNLGLINRKNISQGSTNAELGEDNKEGNNHPPALKSCLTKSKSNILRTSDALRQSKENIGGKEHRTPRRKDQIGTTIRHRGQQKVTFVDQIKGHELAVVHFVTSYKKYNADVSQKCNCGCLLI